MNKLDSTENSHQAPSSTSPLKIILISVSVSVLVTFVLLTIVAGIIVSYDSDPDGFYGFSRDTNYANN